MSTQIYPPKKKSNNPYASIWEKYSDLYAEKFGIKPEISYGATGRIISQRAKNHSVEGLVKIVELFFENEKGNITYDLKAIMSAFFINKYAPKLKLDPKMYSNAEEWNKKVY